MTSFPSLPLPILPVATQQAQAAVALTAKANELMAKMGVGQDLTATVTGQLGHGTVEVSTAQGNFQLRLPIPVPDGAQLLLRQMPAGQLRLLAVNGQPVAPHPAPPASSGNSVGLLIASLQAGPAQGSPAQPGLAMPQDRVQIGTQPGNAMVQGATGNTQPAGLPATVIAGPPASLANPAQPPLPPGTALTLRLTGIESSPQPRQTPSAPDSTSPARTDPVPRGTSPMPAAAAPSSTPSPMPPQTLPGQPPSLQSGQPVIQDPLPSADLSQPPATPAGASPTGTPLRGEVLPGHYGTRAVIASPLGTIALDAPLELTPGASVSIEVLHAQPPQPGTATNMVREAAPSLPAAHFAALQDAIEVLGQAAPAEAEALMKALPQAGPRLAMAMIATVQGLRAGDVRGTPSGSAGRALENLGHKETARKLLGEFESQSTEARQGPGEWRAHAIPFLNGAEIEEIRLYTRPPPQEADADGQKQARGRDEGSRFLVNLSLSRLGPMQFDGLVRRESRRFDLIIRTQDALSPQMRGDIAGLFAQACELSGVVGQVSFQAGRPFVAADSSPAAARGVMV